VTFFIRVALDRWGPGALRLLGQGRRSLERVRVQPALSGGWCVDGRAYGLLPGARLSAGVPGPAAVGGGRETGDAAGRNPHDPSWVMSLPLVVLGSLSAVGGLIQSADPSGPRLLGPVAEPGVRLASAPAPLGLGGVWRSRWLTRPRAARSRPSWVAVWGSHVRAPRIRAGLPWRALQVHRLGL